MADESVATLEAPVEAAPPAESTPDNAPVGGSEQGASELPTSLEDAFRQARTQVPEDTAEPAQDGKPADAAGEAPATDSAATTTPTEEKTLTSQGQIDRVYQLWKQGRAADLDPAERGILNRFENDWLAKHVAKQSEEEQFEELYLGLLAQEAEDPEEFAKTLRGEKGENLLRFMKAYSAAHPDLTLDSPKTPTLKRDDVRRSAITEAFDTVDTAILNVASDYGLGEEALVTAYEKTGGDFTGYLREVVNAAVKAEVAREAKKIAASEREASAAEITAARATRTIITPRPISSAPAAQQGSAVDHRSSDPFGQAARLARQAEEQRAS